MQNLCSCRTATQCTTFHTAAASSATHVRARLGTGAVHPYTSPTHASPCAPLQYTALSSHHTSKDKCEGII
eukprot:jgi/Chrzof1/1824/Cz10g22160.t1